MKNITIFLFLVLSGFTLFKGSEKPKKIKTVTCKEFLMIDTKCQRW